MLFDIYLSREIFILYKATGWSKTNESMQKALWDLSLSICLSWNAFRLQIQGFHMLLYRGTDKAMERVAIHQFLTFRLKD